MENVQVLVSCESLSPVINLVRGGIWPVIQFVIPLIIIILGAVDLGKAVAGGDEKKTKEAQSTFVKRIIYGVAIFFVPLIVGLIFSMLKDQSKGTADNFVSCWDCYPDYSGAGCK